MDRGSLPVGLRRRIETLVCEAPTVGAWRRFSVASALAEGWPLEALRELEEVSWMVEAAISRLVEAKNLCETGERVW